MIILEVSYFSIFSIFYFVLDYTVSIDNNSTFNFDRASGAFNVNLTVRINFQCNISYYYQQINCTALSCNNTISGKLSPDGVIQQDKYIINDQEHGVFNYTFTGLEPCGHIYIAKIEIINTLGVMKDHDDIIISKFICIHTFYFQHCPSATPSSKVQDVLVSSEGYTNGSVDVQCVFEPGSTADGCHVIFTDTTNGRNESFNITGSDNTMISLSTSGHYTVTVYDIINGNIIPWTCVQPKRVNVTSTISASASSILTSNSEANLHVMNTVQDDLLVIGNFLEYHQY